MKLGYGMRRTPARRYGNGWYVSVTAYSLFIVFCRCPK
jgi:hypothetical protein